MRAGFARSAGRLAVMRATRAQIKALEDVQRKMGVAASASNSAKFHELNLRFHTLLLDAAANARCAKWISPFRTKCRSTSVGM